MISSSNIITDKRLRNELKELKKNKIDFAQAIQDENNKFIFYFLLKGDSSSDYNGGYYIGKIMLPENYPTNPGDFMMLTPSGRFLINSKICLTNSSYHKDSWTPTWNIRNMIIGFSSIFNTDFEHGISHIKDTSENRKMYAKKSVQFNLTNYGNIFKLFDQFINSDGNIKENQEIKNDLNKSENKTNIINIKNNNKTRLVMIKEYIKLIEKMSFINFDKEPYEKIYNLMNFSITELS